MLKTDEKILFLDEPERNAILSYCSNFTVAFISMSDNTFYGSGILINIKETVGILTAAHVVNKIEQLDDCRTLFCGSYSNGKKWTGSAIQYKPIACRVTDKRTSRDWKPSEKDIGLIIPSPEMFNGINDIKTIDLKIDSKPNRFYSAETAILLGFPKCLQENYRQNQGIFIHPVYTQYIQVPNDCLKEDIALGWTKVFRTEKKVIEIEPNAQGMSGGPIFSYIMGSIDGPWTAEKQLVFNGILHYQHDERCLIGHSRNTVIKFIKDLLDVYDDQKLKSALANGYKQKG